jgi:uncharacterized membrane protein YhhN
MRTNKILIRLFVAISILYLAAIYLEVTNSRFYLKPLLLLPLMVAAFTSKTYKFRWFLFTALLFSWIGDILLLSDQFFIWGLISFLAAHIFYIILFNKELKTAGGKISFKSVPALIIFLYLITFLSFLLPRLVFGLQIPITVYAIIISMMLYIAYLLSQKWHLPSSLLLLLGATSFLISDSILAIHKFYAPISLSDIIIMVTYLFAQGAIAVACLTRKNISN